MEALRVQRDGEVLFPRGDPPTLKTVTEAVSQSSEKWRAASCKPFNVDDSRNEIRRLSDECKREKDPVKRKYLPIAIFRARRKARRAQETQRFKDAVQ